MMRYGKVERTDDVRSYLEHKIRNSLGQVAESYIHTELLSFIAVIVNITTNGNTSNPKVCQ